MSSVVHGPCLHALPREASAVAGSTVWQLAAGAGLLSLLAAALEDVGPARLVAAGLCGLLVLGVSLLRLVATWASPEREADDPALPDAELPAYTLLVPLYREAGVVPQLLAALRGLDYPASLLQVLVLVEGDDTATRDALTAAASDDFEVLVMPPGEPRTKPRALSAGLPLARGTLLCVYDAEDLPAPDQLRRAAARFAAEPDLACLQARLAIDNPRDGWLAALFALEYAALFDVLDPGLAQLGLPLLLGGTSNHFRTDQLRRAGGWDPWNVTEDADLGLRLARHGMRVGTLASTTHEEAPARPRAWLRQRRRWMKGWMQTLVVHTRDPARLWRDLGPLRCLAALGLLANGLGTSLAGLGLAVLLLRDLAEGQVQTVWLVTALAGVASVAAPLRLAMRRRRLGHLWPVLWLLPLRWALLTLAAWLALFDLWWRPFHWGTTRHGLAPRPAPRLT